MNVFSTDVLLGVVNAVKTVPQFLLNTFFGSVQTEESEEIHFDVLRRGRRVAPFVSPFVEGQIVLSAGFETKTFKPAYVKPKTAFNPRRALKRVAGEPLTGAYSAQARIDRLVRMDLMDHRDQIDRRLEVMAGEALLTGKVTVVGDKYPEAIVDFGRDPSLTYAALTGAALWTDPDSTPLADIEQWALDVLRIEGVQITDVLMTTTAWTAFSVHADVRDLLDNRRIVGNGITAVAPVEGAVFRGEIDGRNIWTYAAWYVDPADDTEKPIIADGHVIGVSRMIDGVRAFGAIAEAVGAGNTGNVILRAVPYAPTSWVENDPPMRYLMTQSAPLVVPTRPNASFSCEVV